MIVTAKCGCEISLYVWHSCPRGCCCGECYPYDNGGYDVEDVEIEVLCDLHSGLDKAE